MEPQNEINEYLFPELTSDFVNVKIKIKAGWLTLEGEVENDFQKKYARKSIARKVIEDVGGVVGVSNKIKVVSKTV